MKLKEIHLKNFRCYEDLTVPLHKDLTVLVALNGRGKTAILDAISIALWEFVKKFDLAKPYTAYNIGINKDDIRIIKKDGQMIRQLNTEIIATDIKDFSWKRYKNSEVAGSKTKEDKNSRLLQKRAKEIQQKIRKISIEEQELYLFSYYGTGRLWNEKRLMERQKKNKNDSKIRTFAYQNSLDPASSYKQFEDWFLEKSKVLFEYRLRLLEIEKQHTELFQVSNSTVKNIEDKIFNTKNAIENIKRAIDIVLKITNWSEPRYSSEFKGLVLEHKKYGILKLDQLSDGIQNVFGMVADIAYRCYLLNSHLGENAIKKTKGIVLIDEVDMHLHPEWQQVILRDLQLAFPNLQFIVTTHSPQVLTTVSSECIRIIDEQQIHSAPAGTKGAESSRLLERIFGVQSRPPQDENTKILAEYRQLVYADKWTDERAKKLRKQLDDTFQGNEPELTALDLYIDNREWELSLEENQ